MTSRRGIEGERGSGDNDIKQEEASDEGVLRG
jgi:hypothetical protein